MTSTLQIERELREGLEGCTEGPWSLGVGVKGELRLIRIYGPYDDERISGEFAKDEDAEHAARCDPDTIRLLLDELSRQREVIEKMQDALQPSADRLTSIDHLRLHVTDPETFGFDMDSAEGVVEAIDAALAAARALQQKGEAG
ncbi:hypothetical protein EN816_00580 [Mesorhizobium sp. M8A.F.Ca.ET.173.01.1.1]|nr:hypothetical protein EN816_00580 [Mesorhizobium sp. M8A.F.Ca.ET.173.01.1.1]